MNNIGFKYFAFISYSRVDSRAASWLQRRLEWFHFPVKLVKEANRPGHKKYIRPVFRDRTDLKVNSEHYWANIKAALDESRFLIVLCTPASAISEPVNLEVQHFLNNPERKDACSCVIPVILHGTVNKKEETECRCPALRNMGGRILDRNLPSMIADEGEGERDGWENGFAGLVSFLLDLDKEAIGTHIQRQERKRAYRGRVLACVFASLAVMAVIGGLWAWKERREADAARMRTQQAFSRSDFLQGTTLLEQRQNAEGMAHLARAIRADPNNVSAIARMYSALVFRDFCCRVGKPIHNDGGVAGVEFDPDGRHVVVWGDRTARVWDAVDGQPVSKPIRVEIGISEVRFSPNGRWVVTASWDKNAQVWDARTGEPIGKPMLHDGVVRAAQFSHDGKWVVTASTDGTARVWDATTGEPVGKPMLHEGDVDDVEFSPDGRWILTRFSSTKDGWEVLGSSSNEAVTVWDATTGKAVCEPMRHEGYISSAQFSPDGRWVVTASSDKTARVWDATTGKAVCDPMRHEDAINSAQFSPDGRWVVTASSDKTARVWDATTGKAVCEPMRHEGAINSAQFSPDGRWVVTASRDKTARVWDATTGKPVCEPMRHEGVISSAQFSPEGRRIVTATWLGFVSGGGTAQVWDMVTGRPANEPMRHTDGATQACFSPDGRRVVSVSHAGYAQVWDAATCEPVSVPMWHGKWINTVQFSPDGRWIVTASWDCAAQVWNSATGGPVGEPMRHGENVTSAQFSPDGHWIVTASWDTTARIWDAATGKPASVDPMRHEGAINSAQFSADGRWVVTASDDKTARVWDVTTGKPVSQPMRHADRVKSAQFSADGRWVVTASEDVRVWDATTGKPVGDQMQHEEGVGFAQFSPDGCWVVTASYDGAARVWDATTGKPVSEPMRHDDAVLTAQFSPDGCWVVTASADRTVRVWEIGPGNWQLIAETVAEAGELIGQIHINETGGMQPVEGETKEQLLRLQEAQQEKSESGRLVAWLRGQRQTRSLTPFSRLSVANWIENRLREFERCPLAELRIAADCAQTNAVALALSGYRHSAELATAGTNTTASNSLNEHYAESYTRRAIMMAPEDPLVLWCRALVLEEQGHTNAVLAVYGKAQRLTAHRLSQSQTLPYGMTSLCAWQVRYLHLLMAQGKTNLALDVGREVSRQWSKLSSDNPDNLPYCVGRAYSLLAQASVEMNVGALGDALPTFRQAVAAWRKVVRHDLTYKTELARACGALSWCSVLGGRSHDAIAVAEEGLAADPEQFWIKTNLAHAYLFNGQFEKAKEIYETYLGQAFEDGRKWNDELRNDFKLLREAGREHPDMKKIEALLEDGE